MIKYVCDWCHREFPLNEISTVKLGNVYNKPIRFHICWECAKIHMPESARASVSWTSP